MINFGELIPQVDHHESALIYCRVVVSRYLFGLLRHKDVDYEHNDLANDLDLLLFKVNGVGLLEVQLVTQLFKVFNHSQEFFVLVEDDELEFVLS